MNLPKGRPRPPLISHKDQLAVRLFATTGGKWSDFKGPAMSETTYYNIVSQRGKYAPSLIQEKKEIK